VCPFVPVSGFRRDLSVAANDRKSQRPAGDESRPTDLVLIGVIRRERDRDIFIRERWYRIPGSVHLARRPAYLAPYLTSACGNDGGAIRFYAEIIKVETKRRESLLPAEKKHPRAGKRYYQYRLGDIHYLSRPVRNRLRRRVTFAYTSLTRLKEAREVGELFGIPPLEEIFREQLDEAGIDAQGQYRVLQGKKCRFRLDFAIFCHNGKIAVECDHSRWHQRPSQQKKDRKRDRWLEKHGWEVIHLSEVEIIKAYRDSISRIKERIEKLGGSRKLLD